MIMNLQLNQQGLRPHKSIRGIAMNKETKGMILLLVGGALFASGFDLIYGLSGALISSGSVAMFFGMVCMADKG